MGALESASSLLARARFTLCAISPSQLQRRVSRFRMPHRIRQQVRHALFSQRQRGRDSRVSGQIRSSNSVSRSRARRSLRLDRIQARLVRHTMVPHHVCAHISACQDFPPLGHALARLVVVSAMHRRGHSRAAEIDFARLGLQRMYSPLFGVARNQHCQMRDRFDQFVLQYAEFVHASAAC